MSKSSMPMMGGKMKNALQSIAHLSISYEKPKGIFNCLRPFLLADWYGRWCLKNMLNYAEEMLANVHAGKLKIL